MTRGMADAPFQAVLFDVDGTLVDSNDAHARAWQQALREHGIEVAFDDVRQLIGMGGDKVLPKLSGYTEDSEAGAAIAERRRQIFTEDLLPTLTAFADAAALVAALRARGYRTVAASSAKGDELARLLEIAGASTHFDATTSSDDADASKPDPDIVLAALSRIDVPAEAAIMIGDTPYDVEAATRAGVACVAFRCGGWSDDDLAGALAVYDGPADLLAELDQSPLVGKPTRAVGAPSTTSIAHALAVQERLEER
jgi:HAD superfamily hydrolase (TIGR01509 family)